MPANWSSVVELTNAPPIFNARFQSSSETLPRGRHGSGWHAAKKQTHVPDLDLLRPSALHSRIPSSDLFSPWTPAFDLECHACHLKSQAVTVDARVASAQPGVWRRASPRHASCANEQAAGLDPTDLRRGRDIRQRACFPLRGGVGLEIGGVLSVIPAPHVPMLSTLSDRR